VHTTKERDRQQEFQGEFCDWLLASITANSRSDRKGTTEMSVRDPIAVRGRRIDSDHGSKKRLAVSAIGISRSARAWIE
jgi:hypothetical protein